MVHTGPVGQIVDGSGLQKKRPGGRFSAFPVPGVAIHPAGQQVVEDADDRQQEQKEDEGAADVKANAEQPEDDENRHDCPDQTRQECTSVGWANLDLRPDQLDMNAIIYHGSTMTGSQGSN